METAAKTLSLKWYEVIVAKVVKNTSETLSSLDNYGVDYLLKLYEFLTFEDYMEGLQAKDRDIKKGQQKTAKSVGDFLKNLG